MPTRISERVSVQTIIRDKVAQGQSTKRVALYLLGATPSGLPTELITAYDWDTILDTTDDEYYFAQAFFGQELKPLDLLLIGNTDATTASNVPLDLTNAELIADFYFVCYMGTGQLDQEFQVEISKWVNAAGSRKIAVIQSSSELEITTDNAGVGFVLRSLGQDRTVSIFHPTSVDLNGTIFDTSTQRADAAILGRLAPTDEGTSQWDYNSLRFVSDSNLSATQQSILTAKGVQWIETFKNEVLTHLYNGRTVTGREIRIQWGADWHDINVQSEILSWAFSYDLMAFDLETFGNIEGILVRWRRRLIDKRIIVSTIHRDSTIIMPNPDSIDAATRASGILVLSNVYNYALNSAVDEWHLQGNFRINI